MVTPVVVSRIHVRHFITRLAVALFIAIALTMLADTKAPWPPSTNQVIEAQQNFFAGSPVSCLKYESDGSTTIGPLHGRDGGVVGRIMQRPVIFNVGITHCRDVTVAHLNAIQTLELSTANIEEVSASDFEHLTRLHTLYLRGNRLSSLNRGMFSGLTELKILHLQGNNISSLHRHTFAGLSKLEELRLEDNDLTTLHDHTFRGLSSLRTLRLDQNKFTSLEEDKFKGLSNLETLRLDNNPDLPIPEPSFFQDQALHHLTELRLGSGRANDSEMAPYKAVITTLTALYLNVEDAAQCIKTDGTKSPVHGRTQKVVDEIVRTSQLNPFITRADTCADVDSSILAHQYFQFLQLHNKGITALRAGDFAGMSNLRTLRLDGNQLTSLPEDIFDGLTSLQTLRLEGNQLTSLPNDVFNGLSNLRTLRLYNNPDLVVPEPSFFQNQSLNELRELHLATRSTVSASGWTTAQERTQWNTVPMLQRLTNLRLNVETPAQCGTGPLNERTLKVTDAIVASVSGITNCRNITSTHLAAITSLDISSKSLFMLRAGDFDGLTGLTTLHLHTNDLTSLPANVFSGLTALTTLNLYSNKLTTLPANVFSGLTALTTLHLYSNKLTTLPANVFNGLSNLTTLRLDQNPDLAVLEPSYFDGQSLTSLTTLYLGSGLTNAQELAAYTAVISTLTTLYLNVEDAATTCGTSPLQGRTQKVVDGIVDFTPGVDNCADITSTHLESLPILVLNRKDITALRAGDFDGLINLPTLAMAENELTSLPANIFNGLSNLKTLSISKNQLTSLHKDTFAGLSNLGADGGFVSLSENELTYIDGGTFRDQSLLPTLWLYDNKLASVHKDAFDGLSSMKDLRLYENELTSLHEDTFEDLSSLTQLYLYENQLTSLHEDLLDGLINLRTIRLDSNNIRLMPDGMLNGLTSLENFRIDGNPDFIPPEAAYFADQGLESLATLVIGTGYPSAEEVAPFKALLPSLVTLRMDVRTAATCLTDPSDPSTAGPLHHRTLDVVELLIDLYFTGRECEDITATDLESLDTVRLDDEELTMLRAGDFDGMTNVRYLDLRDNELPHLPLGVFDGLPNLERLYLNHNDLTHLHEDTFRGLPNLTQLRLYSNLLLVIDSGTFNGLSSLEILRLENNELTSLPRDLFDDLSSLQGLYLWQNRLTSLHKDTFAELSNLETLSLYSNRLSVLPSDIFNGLSNLQTLLLYDNPELVNLEPYVFQGQGLSSLITLRMGFIEANASELSSYQAAGLPRLGRPDPNMPAQLGYLYLHLEPMASCGSSPVDDWTQKVVDAVVDAVPDVTACEDIETEHLAAITSLDLSGQSILTLYADDFAGMSGLTTLRLNGNLLAYLPANVFAGLSSLTTLDLSNNRLTYLPRGIFSGLFVSTSMNPRNDLLASLPAPATTEGKTIPQVFNRESSFATLRNPYANMLLSAPVPMSATNEIVTGIFNGESGLTALDSNVSRLASLPAPAISKDETVSTGLTALDVSGNNLLTYPAAPATLAEDGSVRDIFKKLSSALTVRDVNGDARDSLPMPALATSEDETVQVNLQLSMSVLDLSNNMLTSLDAGTFSGLSGLRTLNLNNNMLTSLVAGTFTGLSGLETLNLNNNMLALLESGAFQGLSSLQQLHMRNNRLTSLPTGLFGGLSQLLTLRLDANPRIENPQPSWFRGQGLNRLTTLYLGLSPATTQQLATYKSVLPAIRYLHFNGGTARVREFYIRIRRIEPAIESVVIETGAKVRLALKVFGRQDIQDDSLADDLSEDRVSFIWTSSDDSGEDGFEESTSYANRRNQEADDRTVLYTAPDVPGEYTVTARLDSGQCVGGEEECSATVKVIVKKIIAIPPSPTPIPCQISGEIPSVVTDSVGNQYSVFTPAQGGTFSSGDRTADITAPINAIQGCEYIGIRLETNGMASDTNDDTHRYTLAGQRYSISAVDSRGAEIFDYQFDVPARVCVPMPPSLRGGITDISLIKLNHAPDSDIADSLTVLSSKIVIMPNGDPRVCGVLGSLPAEIAAGNRGAPTPVPTPMPSPTPQAPQTGGGTVPYSWIMLFAILGIGVIMLGSAVLMRGKNTSNSRNRN